MTINDELLEALKAALNTLVLANEHGLITDTIWHGPAETLFDFIGSAIAKAEAAQAERVEPAKDVNSTHTPAAWQVWVGADTPLNAPMGWQFYNTYDSLRSAEATARAINAAQQAPFAKIIPLYTTPPAAAVSEPWQPIETAPKDFLTIFDGWNGERVADVSWAHPEYSPKGYHAWCISEYTNGHGWDNVEVKGLTHWMPLPPAPSGVNE